MSKETTEEQKGSQELKYQGYQVRIQDVLYIGLRNWPWILASVVICVGLAFFYVLRTPPVYTRTASVNIKDDTNGKSMTDIGDFSNFGIVQTNTNTAVEVAIMQSSGIMEEVIRVLNLDMNYSIAGRFHREVIYGKSLPVKVILPDIPDNQSASLTLDIARGGKMHIGDFMRNGKSIDSNDVTCTLGDTVNTPLGKILIYPTDVYSAENAYNIGITKSALKSAIDSYMSRLTVTHKNEKIPVVVMSFTDQSIQRAEDVLNTLIAIYNENWIRDKNQIAVSTSNFIDERLAVIENELGSVDQDISRYKSEHLIPDVQAVQSIDLQQSMEMSQQLLILNNQLQMTRYVRNYITDEKNNDKILPSNSGIDNPSIEGQINTYNEMLLSRKSLAASSSDSNPLVSELDRSLSDLRKAIITSVDNQILSLNTQIRSMQRSEAQATSRIAANPAQAKYLLSVERQQKIKESLYLFLLQKREENELTQAFTAYNTRIIELPSGSDAPTAPARSKILLASFLIGLLLPFGIIYLQESSNTKIRGRKDIESLTLPFLGEIPFTGRKKGLLRKAVEEKSIVVKSGKRDVINEAFRVLRTNVEFMKGGNTKSNVLVITSFNPGSGKSFIAINLAMSLAIKERKVLLIDGDMRHGSTSAFINNPREGLSNYLSGSINDIRNVIVKDKEHTNLSILPIGKMPPNPTELLEDGKFGKLIEDMRSEYDYILIDCPPIEIVADTQIVEQYADRTIFVVRSGLFARAMLPELERIYTVKKFKNMALILNGTMSGNGHYGYSYRYGYGYGYGYGYHYGNQDE